MSMTSTFPQTGLRGWLNRAEAWLDSRGKPAWIAAMVLGFIIFWPIGLALLAYMIWGKHMFGHSCRRGHRGHHRNSWNTHEAQASWPTGNAAFDSYRTETLRKLEEEQAAFEAFLHRLREARDKTEFDNFMEDRARRQQEAAASPEAPPASDPPARDVRPGEY